MWTKRDGFNSVALIRNMTLCGATIKTKYRFWQTKFFNYGMMTSFNGTFSNKKQHLRRIIILGVYEKKRNSLNARGASRDL